MKKANIHFIGIGGIGVSALAGYYLEKEKGYLVSGSDLVQSEITNSLKKRRAEIFIGAHKKENLPLKTKLVIYSLAIKNNNPELREAIKRGIKTLSYPEALGELTRKYYTIAISGTHGKSTTSAMISLILIKAGLDPTVIIGTKLKEFKNKNYRVGKSRYLVIEADEYKGAFLNYWPKIIVLTNIEAEHLDYFKNLKREINTYKKYISHLPEDGVLVINIDNKNTRKIYKELLRRNKNVLPFSIKERQSTKIREILRIPGEHNIANALASYKVARYLGIKEDIIVKSLSQYKGSWRRFEIHNIRINKKKVILIHDYAHHPTELKALFSSVREKFKGKRILAVFQPHQYQRTIYLFKDFVKTLKEAKIDKIIITDIYEVAGREDKKRISSKDIVSKVNKKSVVYVPQSELLDYLKENLKEDILLSIGAGDIYYTLKPLEKYKL